MVLSSFNPYERAQGTHWIRGFLGLRAGLEAMKKTKSLAPVKNRILILLLFSRKDSQYKERRPKKKGGHTK
jgi:hypothetical protein